MKHFHFIPLDASAACEIASWQYPGAYAQYDLKAGDCLTPSGPGSRFFVSRSNDAITAFCSFGLDGRVNGWEYDNTATDVGAGLRPDLTGKGMGALLLRTIVDHGRSRLRLGSLRATIATWNTRALKAAHSAGFSPFDSFLAPSGMEFSVVLNPSKSHRE